MKFHAGDWAKLKTGKVAHLLAKGYHGPFVLSCMPTTLHEGTGERLESSLEPEELIESGDAPKCKKCLKIQAKRRK